MKGDAQPRCDLLEISYLCGRINNIVCVKYCITVGYMDY